MVIIILLVLLFSSCSSSHYISKAVKKDPSLLVLVSDTIYFSHEVIDTIYLEDTFFIKKSIFRDSVIYNYQRVVVPTEYTILSSRRVRRAAERVLLDSLHERSQNYKVSTRELKRANTSHRLTGVFTTLKDISILLIVILGLYLIIIISKKI